MSSEIPSSVKYSFERLAYANAGLKLFFENETNNAKVNLTVEDVQQNPTSSLKLAVVSRNLFFTQILENLPPVQVVDRFAQPIDYPNGHYNPFMFPTTAERGFDRKSTMCVEGLAVYLSLLAENINTSWVERVVASDDPNQALQIIDRCFEVFERILIFYISRYPFRPRSLQSGEFLMNPRTPLTMPQFQFFKYFNFYTLEQLNIMNTCCWELASFAKYLYESLSTVLFNANNTTNAISTNPIFTALIRRASAFSQSSLSIPSPQVAPQELVQMFDVYLVSKQELASQYEAWVKANKDQEVKTKQKTVRAKKEVKKDITTKAVRGKKVQPEIKFVKINQKALEQMTGGSQATTTDIGSGDHSDMEDIE